MRDPYSVLGIAKSSSVEDIKKAYRKMAKECHPDLHPGDAAMEKKFKETSAAYALLSDPEKRRKYDAGEIDTFGNPKGFASGFNPHDFSRRSNAGGSGRRFNIDDLGFDPQDLFNEIFGGRRNQQQRGGQRGADQQYSVSVTFTEAAGGARKRVTLHNRKTLEINIPAGSEDGQILRLKGQGGAGLQGGDAGDALIKIVLETHPLFSRRNKDIYLDLPVGLHEAVLGATVNVPTIDGSVALKIPAASNSDTLLRLKGKGIGGVGDQFVRLKIVMPEKLDGELQGFVKKWADKHAYDPRRKFGL